MSLWLFIIIKTVVKALPIPPSSQPTKQAFVCGRRVALQQFGSSYLWGRPTVSLCLSKWMGHLKSQSTAAGGIERGIFQTHWERFWDCYVRSGRVFGAWGKLCSVVRWFVVCVFWKMLLVFDSSLHMLLHSPEMSRLSRRLHTEMPMMASNIP